MRYTEQKTGMSYITKRCVVEGGFTARGLNEVWLINPKKARWHFSHKAYQCDYPSEFVRA